MVVEELWEEEKAVGDEGWKIGRERVADEDEADCGLCHITDESIRESLRKRCSGPEEVKEVDEMSFGSIVE